MTSLIQAEQSTTLSQAAKQINKMPTGQQKKFNRFILNNHQRKTGIDQQILDKLKQEEPSKTIACQRCRRLRKKCSKHFPQCLTCIKMSEDCEYVEKTNTPTKSQDNRKHQLTEGEIEVGDEDASHVNKKSKRGSINSRKNSTNDITLLPPLTQNTINWQYNVHEDLPQQHSSSLLHEAPSLADQDNYTYAELTNTSRTGLNISGINQAGPSIIRLPSISNMNQQEKLAQSQPQKPVHQPTDIQNAILSTLINLGKQNLIPTTNITEPLMIRKEHVMKYVDSYFKSFYEEYPFIHKQEFYKEFEQINLFNVFNPNTNLIPLTDLKRNTQVYLILTIGFKSLYNSNLLSHHEIQQHLKIFHDVSRVNTLIYKALTFNTIDDIKILLLLVIDSFFTRNCISTTNLANLLIGLTLKFNLHRKLTRVKADQLQRFEIEMRYRLFWSVYIIDRTVSLYLNKLIGIPDEYINLPYSIRLDGYDDDVEDGVFDVNFKLNIELKQIEGKIFKEVHSVLAINNNSLKNDNILKNLRNDIEAWYLKTTRTKTNNSGDGIQSLWNTTRYYNCLTILYRHSYLNPVLTPDLMDKLAKAVLQNLSYSYNLTINKNWFSMNWMSFFRILVIFKTLLKCLVKETINIYESKTELNLCIELLKNYISENNSDWDFIHEIIEIFQDLLKLSYNVDGIELDHEKLTEIMKQSDEKLSFVLKKHTVGCRLDDKLEDEYTLDEAIEAEYRG